MLTISIDQRGAVLSGRQSDRLADLTTVDVQYFAFQTESMQPVLIEANQSSYIYQHMSPIKYVTRPSGDTLEIGLFSGAKILFHEQGVVLALPDHLETFYPYSDR